MNKLNSKIIEKDSDPEIGELLEVTLPEAGRTLFLRAQCGTGRTCILPVPNYVTTARQANALTYGLEPEELQLEART